MTHSRLRSIKNFDEFELGFQSDDVLILQMHLCNFGYLTLHHEGKLFDIERAPIATNGLFDTSTKMALEKFQDFHHIPITGTVDERTVEFLLRDRCGVPDPVFDDPTPQFVKHPNKWQHLTLRYRFLELTNDISHDELKAAISEGFDIWSRVTPLNFAESDLDPDIQIRFVQGEHGDGTPMDGPNGVLAHAFFPPPNGGSLAGDIHFDDAEVWSIGLSADGRDLLTVAIHEIGHSLGLEHSSVFESIMYAYYMGVRRALHTDDIAGIRSIYGCRMSDIKNIPGWFGGRNDGCGIDLFDVTGSGHKDIFVFHIDNTVGENRGYYRIGWNMDSNGNPQGGWSAVKHVPGWFGGHGTDSAIAFSDVSHTGRPDMVVFHIDNPPGENRGFYRVGWDIDAGGNPTGWSDVKLVPGWFGADSIGAGVALGDLTGSGMLDVVVFHIDNPPGENRGYYRIGFDLNASGDVTGGWGVVMPIPGWFGAENHGGGIALADISGSGRPDIVVFHIDNPLGENHGYYRIGYDLDANGNVTGGWGHINPVAGWFGSLNDYCDIAVHEKDTGSDLMILSIDNPSGENRAFYRFGYDI